MKFKVFFKTYSSALFIVIVLIAFSLFAYYQAYQANKDRKAKLFEMRVQRVSESVKNRMTEYIQILKGCQALYYASDSITQSEWKIYSEKLEISANYPGIQALAYSIYINKNNKESIEKSVIRTGDKDFSIKSTFKNQFLTPVIYIEPLNFRNKRAIGFDLYSETYRREAMDRAISTGKPALTRKITLVQETNKDVQPGFLMFLPLYKTDAKKNISYGKENIKGFVSNVFRAHDLLSALLNRFTELDIKIYDGKSMVDENLLYSSSLINEKIKNKKTNLYGDTLIIIAGVPWRIFISPTNEFTEQVETNQPVLILIFGLAVSALIFILAINNIKRKAAVFKELIRSRKLENVKDEFIGIASHELKTPLTSIKASVQLLARSDLKDKEKTYVQKAISQINKLNNLIGDLLDVSKIQAGKLQLNYTSFLLKELLDDSIENVQHYSSHEIITSHEVPDITIKGDKFRLEQAITNLLINAIKYSPNAAKVYLNTQLLNNSILIEIKDTGIGISEENQKKIFERYFRAEELSPVISGLGIGLYITHEIIKRHHGEIGVSSELNKETTFFFTLPIESDSDEF